MIQQSVRLIQNTVNPAQKQSGITLTVSTPLTQLVQGAQDMQHLAQSGRQADDPRMQAMAGVTNLLKANELVHDAEKIKSVSDALDPTTLSVSIGSSQSKSSSTDHHETYQNHEQ